MIPNFFPFFMVYEKKIQVKNNALKISNFNYYYYYYYE
jgi:hypothetical protein